MKTIYLLSTCLTFLLTVLFSANLSSQATEVGYLKNGNPVISSLANATAVLKGGLNNSSTVTDIYIDKEPGTDRYFLIGMIRNSNVTGKAVELQLKGGRFSATPGGPALEITCTGVNCSQCVPKLQTGGAICLCKDNPQQPNSQCDMTSKIILSIW